MPRRLRVPVPFALLMTAGLAVRLGLLAWPRPFWMDERFSAALAAQPVGRLIEFSRADVHPPLYYLALWGWNRLGAAVCGAGGGGGELVAYRLPGIGRQGEFTLRDTRGRESVIPGLYPEDWPRWPLAPLWFLRLPSVGFAMAAAGLAYRFGRRLWPGRPAVALLALAMTLFSPFMLTWDGVIRSYSMQSALLMGCALASVEYARKRGAAEGACALAGLVFLALLTAYLPALAAPFLAAALWRNSVTKRRAWALLGGMAAGAAMAAALWGGAFLWQNALHHAAAPPADSSFLRQLPVELAASADTLWRTLFSCGVAMCLNPYTAPISYGLAFALYAAAFGFGVFSLVRRRSFASGLSAALAFGPLAIIALANAVRPGAIPLQARYYCPFAPFFFLFLSSGIVALVDAVRRRMDEGDGSGRGGRGGQGGQGGQDGRNGQNGRGC